MRYTIDEYKQLRRLAGEFLVGDTSFTDIISGIETEEQYIKFLKASIKGNFMLLDYISGYEDLYRSLYDTCYEDLPLLVNVKYPYAKKVIEWRLIIGK